MKKTKSLYHGHRFPAVVISYAVRWYFRFSLSLRDVSGAEEQFKVAGEWLDALAEALGCPQNQVQMVPGNHDLNRKKTSRSAEFLLDLIRAGGSAEYEIVVNNPLDRAAWFARSRIMSVFAGVIGVN